MKRLEGVTKTELITKVPVHIDIKLKDGAWVDPKGFIDQIAKAGYQARKDDIVLTVQGTVAQEDGKLILKMEDVKPLAQKFVLSPETSKKTAESESFSSVFKQVGDLIDKKVEIEGRWSPPGKTAELASLAVRAIRTVER